MERLVIENVWVRRTAAYGVGVQNADIASFLINGLYLEDIGSDGIDFKAFTSYNGGLARKEGIINNVQVRGHGRVDPAKDAGAKTGMDLRGFTQASNLYVHSLKRTQSVDLVGIRVNADATADSGRIGGRTVQVSNARVICTDTTANQSVAGGRCVGMEIAAQDVSVSNYTCEGAHTGLQLEVEGASGSAIQSVALSNIRIAGARGSDGLGAGIYWTGASGGPGTATDTQASGYSQLGPFHITDCDRGIEVHGPYLRGSGFVRDCDHGLYFASQTIANQTWLDVMFFNNVDDVSPGVGLGYKRPAPLFMEGTATYDPASVAVGASLPATGVTVAGAVPGDFVMAISHTQPSGMQWFGAVTSADGVTVRGFNPTTAAIDLPSGTLTVLVERRLHT